MEPGRGVTELVQNIAQGRERYALMVGELRAGRRLPAETIFATLHAAKRTAGELVVDVLTERGPQPGGRCPECGAEGAVRVSSSKRQRSGEVVRYLGCRKCAKALGKIRVPGASIPRRSPRSGGRAS